MSKSDFSRDPLSGIRDPRRSNMTRLRAFSLFPCALSLLLIAGCRQDMHNQPKYRGLRASAFFADGSSARPLVEGTVARGTLQEDEAFFTGKIDKATVKEFPIPIDEALLNRGEERYNIYCSPCHDKTGGGNGMVIQRGFARQPPSYHIDRLRQADVGYFYDVITNGFGVMSDYRAQIAPRDRWAIVLYVKSLQATRANELKPPTSTEGAGTTESSSPPSPNGASPNPPAAGESGSAE